MLHAFDSQVIGGSQGGGFPGVEHGFKIYSSMVPCHRREKSAGGFAELFLCLCSVLCSHQHWMNTCKGSY